MILKFTLVLLFYIPFFCNAQKENSNNYLKAKVWGHVKYYSKPNLKIDEELIRLIKDEITLDEFINKNYTLQKRKVKVNNNIIFCEKDYTWINESNSINKKSKDLLFKMLTNNYYNISNKNKKSQENPFAKVQNLSKEQSIIGVSRLWNYIYYFYPHTCKLDGWDIVLNEALNIVEKDYNYTNYLTALKHISNSTKDQHSSFYYYKYKPDSYGTKTLPINYNKVLDGIEVIKVFKDDYPILKNDIILKLNNHSIINNVDYYCNSLNLGYKPFIIKEKKNNLLILRDGKERNIEIYEKDLVSRNYVFNQNWYVKDTMNFSKYKAQYIDVNNVNRKDYLKIKSTLNNYETYILDLRGYPETMYTNRTANLFYKNVQKAYGLVFPIKRTPLNFKIKYASRKEGLIDNQNIYVLINQYTYSHSETLCVSLMNNPNVKFIGNYSASSFGGPFSKIKLPGYIYFTTSTIGVVTSAGTSLHPNGIPLDFLIVDEKEIPKFLDDSLKK